MTETTKFLGKLLSLLKRLHKIVVTIEPWGIMFAVSASLLTVTQFWIDYEDRVRERTAHAWAIVDTTAAGNRTKIEALQYLNKEDGLFCGWSREGCLISRKQRVSLVGIDLSTSSDIFLQGIKLSRADLSDSILPGANLSGAFLSEANLTNARLDKANLDRAILTNAKLNGANLHRASLKGADVTRAKFAGANLTLADFSESIGLLRDQLDDACVYGDFPPVLPSGLDWEGKECKPE